MHRTVPLAIAVTVAATTLAATALTPAGRGLDGDGRVFCPGARRGRHVHQQCRQGVRCRLRLQRRLHEHPTGTCDRYRRLRSLPQRTGRDDVTPAADDGPEQCQQ